MVIIAFARFLSALLQYLRQPTVVAEMIAGILIGPTCLGRIPGFTENVFHASAKVVLSVVASIGLVFFLFLVGMELDTPTLRSDLRQSLLMSFSGVAVPGIVAFGLAWWLNGDPKFTNPEVSSLLIMTLFLTVVLGISALPVLARILQERSILHTVPPRNDTKCLSASLRATLANNPFAQRLGSMSMSVAAIDDIVAWVLLAVMLSLVSSTSKLGVLWVILLILLECLLIYFVVRPVRCG
jgi:Kef-type K+ transport system membrane component KefB